MPASCFVVLLSVLLPNLTTSIADIQEHESRGLRTQSIAELFATQWNSNLTVEVVLRFDPSKVDESLREVTVEGNGSPSTCDEKESAEVTFDQLLSSSLLDEDVFGKVKVTDRYCN